MQLKNFHFVFFKHFFSFSQNSSKKRNETQTTFSETLLIYYPCDYNSVIKKPKKKKKCVCVSL